MARAATTSDVYNAIAEPRRRAILELVADEERAVGDVAKALDLGQPSVSKHLRVLREVKLVNVRRDGRRRLYSANADALRPIHDWVERFERLWGHQLDSIQKRAEATARHEVRPTTSSGAGPPQSNPRRRDE